MHLQIWKRRSAWEGREVWYSCSLKARSACPTAAMAPCVRMDGRADLMVIFAGEQTLVILRFVIVTSQGKLSTNMKEASFPVLRKVVFEEYNFLPILPPFTWLIIPWKGLLAGCSRRGLPMTSSGASQCLPERRPEARWWLLSWLLPQACSWLWCSSCRLLSSQPPRWILRASDKWVHPRLSYCCFHSDVYSSQRKGLLLCRLCSSAATSGQMTSWVHHQILLQKGPTASI